MARVVLGPLLLSAAWLMLSAPVNAQEPTAILLENHAAEKAEPPESAGSGTTRPPDAAEKWDSTLGEVVTNVLLLLAAIVTVRILRLIVSRKGGSIVAGTGPPKGIEMGPPPTQGKEPRR